MLEGIELDGFAKAPVLKFLKTQPVKCTCTSRLQSHGFFVVFCQQSYVLNLGTFNHDQSEHIKQHILVAIYIDGHIC